MAEEIKDGDYVRHSNHTINNGLQISVLEVDEENQKAKCGHFAPDGTHKEDWFDLSDLTLIKPVEGGFI